MTNGQDEELGVCCHCFPYPQCGHWCDVTDFLECNDQGGTWLGGGQLDCNDCEEVCANCQGEGCTEDSQCPEGQICVSGNCVVSTTNPEACNRDGQPNCRTVVHVKRPYYPDGTPAHSEWGVAIWHPPCDSNCDGDIYDEAPVDEDGNFIVAQEDVGPITFELKNDIYDEDGNPIGDYGSSCCCPQYLIVANCKTGPECIDLKDVCPDLIPEWNTEEGEVLVLRGIEGTDAEGYCAYSIYNFEADGTQKYGPCNKPVYEWVLNNGCKYGAGTTDACAIHLLHGPRFCDLDVEVFQVPDPEWVYGVRQRLCEYACAKCYAIYDDCDNCDESHPDYPDGKCISFHACEFETGSVNDQNFGITPQYPIENPCRQSIDNGPLHTGYDCMSRNEIITNEQFAINDFYWNIPYCTQNQLYSPDPCGECSWLMLQLCNCTNCSEFVPEAECPQFIYTYDYNEHWNNKSVLKVTLPQITPGGMVVHICGCYNNMGIVEAKEIPDGAHFSSFISSSVCDTNPQTNVTECHPTNVCTMYSPCGTQVYGGSPHPSCTKWDCSDWCPPWSCDFAAGPPNWGYCEYCCQCDDIACETHPGGNPCKGDDYDYPWGGHVNSGVNRDVLELPSRVNFEALALYPDEIKATLPIDLPTIKTEVPVVFTVDSQPPMVFNPTPLEIESYNTMRPYTHVPNFVKQKLGKVISTGSFADSRMGVPQVNEAHYLGDYMDGPTEWSAWLTFGNCTGVNSIATGTRHFSFTYTIFAYCQSGDCKLDSKVIEKKTVEFFIDARIGRRR